MKDKIEPIENPRGMTIHKMLVRDETQQTPQSHYEKIVMH